MKVTVGFLGILGHQMGITKTIVDVNNDTLSSVIDALTRIYGDKFGEVILKSEGIIRADIGVLLCGYGVNTSDLSLIKVKEGDELYFFFATAGG